MTNAQHIHRAIHLMRFNAAMLPTEAQKEFEKIALMFDQVHETDRDRDAPRFAAWIRDTCHEYGLPVPLPEENGR